MVEGVCENYRSTVDAMKRAASLLENDIGKLNSATIKERMLRDAQKIKEDADVISKICSCSVPTVDRIEVGLDEDEKRFDAYYDDIVECGFKITHYSFAANGDSYSLHILKHHTHDKHNFTESYKLRFDCANKAFIVEYDTADGSHSADSDCSKLTSFEKAAREMISAGESSTTFDHFFKYMAEVKTLLNCTNSNQ